MAHVLADTNTPCVRFREQVFLPADPNGLSVRVREYALQCSTDAVCWSCAFAGTNVHCLFRCQVLVDANTRYLRVREQFRLLEGINAPNVRVRESVHLTML